MNAGCVLEESDVAAPEMLKRLDSKNARQYRLKSLQKERSEANEPLLGISKQPSNFPHGKLLTLSVVWLAFFAVQVLRGGKSSPVSLPTPNLFLVRVGVSNVMKTDVNSSYFSSDNFLKLVHVRYTFLELCRLVRVWLYSFLSQLKMFT